MDKIEKLFRKISSKDRAALKLLINDLLLSKKVNGVKKLEGSDFYRLRKGNFRIIFHYNEFKRVIVDSVRLRQENTYKDF